MAKTFLGVNFVGVETVADVSFHQLGGIRGPTGQRKVASAL
jgi:hypothetical protein